MIFLNSCMDQADKKLVLLHTKQLWEHNISKGENIFITGATGFFGKSLLDTFVYINEVLNLESKIIVLTRDKAKFLSEYPQFNTSEIEFVEGTLSTFEYPKQPISYIIHAANDLNENDNSINIDQRPFIVGTKRILELARQKKVKAILHTSSGAVYGSKSMSQLISEDQYNDNNIDQFFDYYATNKRHIEKLCDDFYLQYHVPSKIARCFAFVGPYLPLDLHYAIGNFIKNYVENSPLIIKGDGLAYRSYLYSADLCIWLWTILFNGKPCRPYNVGSDEYYTLLEIAKKITGFKNSLLPINVLNEKTAVKASWYIPSIQRAKNELQLEVYTTLDLAIEKTILSYTN
jgi:nucleoside-diphosphate-sugar epimerase